MSAELDVIARADKEAECVQPGREGAGIEKPEVRAANLRMGERLEPVAVPVGDARTGAVLEKAIDQVARRRGMAKGPRHSAFEADPIVEVAG
jgi:hypothetical protein